ncbi:hypothetical protein BGP_2331 [Beggiatoa sp. PS]|nr:hypothetical protein BGP_2331 [Beggiatoa sp. PS]
MSQNELHFTHYGKNYKPDIKGLPDAELKALHIDPNIEKLSDAELKALHIDPKEDYLLPSNPVITKAGHPVRIAFFGLNAHSKDKDFKEALEQPNFTEWCQEGYRKKGKLFDVLQLWHDGLPKTYFTDDSAIYYSNFVKIVLRETYFKKGKDVKNALCNGESVKKALCNSETLKLFKRLAEEEVTELSNNGCRLFICFGNIVYDFMRDIIRSGSENGWLQSEELELESESESESENVLKIKERHFSRFIEKNTIESIQAASKWLKNTKQA